MNNEYMASYVSPSNMDLKHWKYIKKYRGKNNKWVYIYDKLKDAWSRDKNPYNSDAGNYEQKKEEITSNDQDWKDAISEQNSEYVKIKEDGSKEYLYDKYLFDKKHPIYDALTDIGNGRKVKTRKQSLNSLVAGAKDHIKMGQKSVENLLTAVVGIATAKVMNNQGSFEDEKREARKTAQNTANMIKNASDSYGNAQSLTKNTTVQAAQETYNNLDPETKAKVNDMITTASIAYDQYKKNGG